MFNHISHSQLFVLDQDQALDFYVGTLGFEVHTDADLGSMRFLTVAYPGEHHEVMLSIPGGPMMDDDTAETVRDLVSKGAAGGGLIIATDDAHAAYDALKAKGVEFTQDVVEAFYGTDFALRDPFGNQIRICQPAEGPVEIPSAQELAATDAKR